MDNLTTVHTTFVNVSGTMNLAEIDGPSSLNVSAAETVRLLAYNLSYDAGTGDRTGMVPAWSCKRTTRHTEWEGNRGLAL